MSFSAKVYQVFIASPSDVSEERTIATEIINEWNNLHSADMKIVLLPVKWETHSIPELGARPQELINKNLLNNCELLIGIFWTRIGTPTGIEDSGTVEEIKDFVSKNKPVMLYFSSCKVNPEVIDNKQYSKLKLFKNEMQSQGLIENYNSKDDFKEKFKRQLAIKINQLFVKNDNNKIISTKNNESSSTSLGIEKIIKTIEESDPKNDWELLSKSWSVTAFYKHDVNLHIVHDSHPDGEGIQNENFRESWANNHPDFNATGYYFDIYYSSTLLKRVILISVDGGRATIPAPKLNTKEVRHFDYKVAEIFDTIDTVDQYLARSGLTIEK